MATKVKPVVNAIPEIRDGEKGITVTAWVPLNGGFTAEKEGAKYNVPQKAKDGNGKLLKSEQGKQLYNTQDGGTTDSPFAADGRTVRDGVVIEPRQATAWMGFKKSLTPEFQWEHDGMIRDLRIELKANNPRTLEVFNETRKAATASKSEKAAGALVNASLDEQLAAFERLKASLIAKGAAV